MSVPSRSKPTDATCDPAPAPQVGSLALLGVIEGGTTIHVIPPDRDVVLGRAEDSDIYLDDKSVSRRHAMIRAGEPPTIEDLGSRNGTRVAGRALAAGERVPLHVGSVAQIGSVTVLVQRDTTAQGDRRPPARTGIVAASPSDLIVVDKTMQQLYELVDVVAPSTIPVLVLGETGVGKEVFAREIHRRSHRANKPNLTLNCAALPESILESELFGHERGAFTGAVQAKAGLFESADGGTVFLDEVGELPLTTQAKLLRVLEGGEVLRLGSVKPMKVDVRFVSATNRDLETRVAEGQFRSDLFFRLNGVTVLIPPLRERPQEIIELARLYAARASAKMNRDTVPLSQAACRALRERAWPGNIRELRNVVERAVLLAHAAGAILPEHLAPPSFGAKAPTAPKPPETAPVLAEAGGSHDPSPSGSNMRAEVRSLEKKQIFEALEQCSGNQSSAAKQLGIARSTLLRRLDEFGVPRPRKRH